MSRDEARVVPGPRADGLYLSGVKNAAHTGGGTGDEPQRLERQTLDSIRDQLAGSDPQLTALLISFTELASGESMPAWERVRPSSRRAVERSYRKRRYQGWDTALRPARRMYRRLMSRCALLLWLLVTAPLISVAVALSRGGGQVACTGPWSAICAHPAPASGSPAASHSAAASRGHG